VDRGREDLRRLAVWLARRRAVDEALAHLTHYGPAASERVHTHLNALRQLLTAEAEAFDALAAAAPDVEQRALPTEAELDDRVVSLSSERTRRQRQDS